MSKMISERFGEITALCRQYGVKSLYAFGSIGGDKFNMNSDIGLLVDLKSDISITDYTENYFALHYKLRNVLNREVDIVTRRSLSNPYFIQSVEQTKQLIYES